MAPLSDAVAGSCVDILIIVVRSGVGTQSYLPNESRAVKKVGERTCITYSFNHDYVANIKCSLNHSAM